MTAAAPSKPALRLVPRPPGSIDGDLVAFRVMEHIDTHFTAMWEAAPVGARASIRNAIVRSVLAEAARSGVPT